MTPRLDRDRGRSKDQSEIEEVLRKREVHQVREPNVRPEQGNVPPSSFNGDEQAPRHGGQLNLLAPPEAPRFLRHNLKGVHVHGRVGQPAGNVNSRGILVGREDTLVTVEAADG